MLGCHAITYVWKAKDNFQELVFFFCPVGPGYRVQVIGLGGQPGPSHFTFLPAPVCSPAQQSDGVFYRSGLVHVFSAVTWEWLRHCPVGRAVFSPQCKMKTRTPEFQSLP